MNIDLLSMLINGHYTTLLLLDRTRCGGVHRDLLEFSLALHQENPEVRHRLQRREAGSRSQGHHCCSR